MGLKDGEDFFVVPDDFARNDAPLDLLDLACGVCHETFDFGFLHKIQYIGQSLALDQGECLAGLLQVVLCDAQIRLVSFNDEGFVFPHLLRRFGLAAFGVLRPRTAPQGMGDMRMRRLTCLAL